MMFIILIFAAALSLEGIGTYVSVVGLASLFAASPVIITLAVCLDFAKLTAVSFLYKHWENINVLMRSYMLVASIVLMAITSVGAFGYLSGQFQKAISNTNSDNVVVQALTEEKDRLQNRKQEIDKQISNLPEKYTANQRIRMINQFKDEQKQVTLRLVEIDKQLPSLKIDTIKKNVEVGPIIYIAEAFNTTPEKAVKWVILTIIFVFDPLAIALLLAGNFLIENKQKKKPKYTLKELLAGYDPEIHGRGEFPESDYFDPPPFATEDNIKEQTIEIPEKTSNEVVTGDGGNQSEIYPLPSADAEWAWSAMASIPPVDEKQETHDDVEIQQPVKTIISPDGDPDGVMYSRDVDEEHISTPTEHIPLAKSSLDKIDPKTGDVILNDGGDHPQLNSLKSMYSTETVSEDGRLLGRQLRR